MEEEGSVVGSVEGARRMTMVAAAYTVRGAGWRWVVRVCSRGAGAGAGCAVRGKRRRTGMEWLSALLMYLEMKVTETSNTGPSFLLSDEHVHSASREPPTWHPPHQKHARLKIAAATCSSERGAARVPHPSA